MNKIRANLDLLQVNNNNVIEVKIIIILRIFETYLPKYHIADYSRRKTHPQFLVISSLR